MVNGFEKNIDILKAYPAFEFIEGDIRDEVICQEVCAGIDYVFSMIFAASATFMEDAL